MPIWVDIAVKLTPAFIALVVGLIASLVAYLQYKTNKDKFRLDLFAKRLEAFEKLQEFFVTVMRDGCVKHEVLATLAEARYKSLFLFGPEIEQYFEQPWKKATEMHALHSRLYGPSSLPVGPERSAICDRETALLLWNTDQMNSCHQRYAPYLRFRR